MEFTTGRQKKVRRARQVRLTSAFLLMAVSGLVWNSFGLFLVALEGEFNWSRAEISGAYGAFALTNALTAPAFGYAISRWDSRRLLAGSALLLGLAFCVTAAVTSIEQYWLAFGVLGGLGAHCTSSFAVFAVLAGRFRQRPATAMAIADAGSGLAAFLGLPLIYWVIANFGWRAAYLMLGMIIAIVGTLLHLFVLDRVRRTPLNPCPVVRKFSFPRLAVLALALSYFCGSAAYHGLLTQQIALFDQRNISENIAVWIAAVSGLVVFLWRLFSGWLCDHWGPERVMLIAAIAAVLTFATLALAVAGQNVLALTIYPLALGIAFGGQQVLLANGAKLVVAFSAFASALGFYRFAAGIGMAAGPVLAGYSHDVTGQYTLAIVLLASIALVHFSGFAAALRFKRSVPLLNGS